MARDSSSGKNNSGASDREMERVLREHFETESPDLRMSKDPWEWLQNRMEEPETPSLLTRLKNSFDRMRQAPMKPLFTGAAAVLIGATAVFWIVSGDESYNEGDYCCEATPEDFERVGRSVSSAATAAPAPTMAPTARPRATPAATATPMAAPTMAPRAMPAAIATPAPTRFRPAPTSEPTAAPRPRPTTAPTAAYAPAGTPAAAPATTFQDYQRERFVSAAVDNVSTFSLDTDRTSYFLALNWARNGYEVDPDSVRAEEWINAFNYGYEQPRRDDSFAISSDIVRHPLDSRMHLARIAFQAPELDYDATPINVTLVLDASGSMSRGKPGGHRPGGGGEHQTQPQRPRPHRRRSIQRERPLPVHSRP